MKKRAAVLCMLAGLLMLLSGCMAGDVSLVDMSVEQPDPVSGKIKLLEPDQNGLTSGEFLFLISLSSKSEEYKPALDSTFDDITLGKDLFFIITNTATQQQYRLTDITLARDPSISYVKDIEGNTYDQLGLLVAYDNIDPGSYSVTNMGGTITYRTRTGTAEETLRASSLNRHNSSFTVVTPTPTPTPKPTDAPTPTPAVTATPTATSTGTATPMPTSAPTVTPTAMPTVTPFVPPKTGDNAAPWTWGVLLLVCGAGLLLMYRRTRS